MRWRAFIQFKNDENVSGARFASYEAALEDVHSLIEDQGEDFSIEDVAFIQVEPVE